MPKLAIPILSSPQDRRFFLSLAEAFVAFVAIAARVRRRGFRAVPDHPA